MKNGTREPQADLHTYPSTYKAVDSKTNPFINPKALDRYLCDTIEQSLRSIDKAINSSNER